jgi:hypothetical protein
VVGLEEGKVARMAIYDGILRNSVPSFAGPFNFKLTMDGSFAANDKSFLSAGLVPLLWQVQKQYLQSLDSVWPLGLAWCGESTESLNGIIPGSSVERA